MNSLSIKKRLIIAFSLIVILSLLLPFLSYRSIFQETRVKEARKDAVRQFENVKFILKREKGINGTKELNELLQSIGDQLAVRISYIGVHGQILADSLKGLSRDQFSNQYQRNEFRQARRGDMAVSIRFEPLTKDRHTFVAEKIHDIKGVQPGILRIARPYSPIEEGYSPWSRHLLIMLVICIGLTGFFSWLFARQFQRQIQKISRAAEAIGQGELRERIDFNPAPDFVPLVLSINRMAKSIRKQIETVFEQKQELQAIFNGLKEGVLVLDHRGRVRKYNKAINDIFHIPYPVQDLEPIEFVRSPELQETYQKLRADPNATAKKVLIRLSGNLYFDVTLIPVQIKEDGLKETIIVFHDVSELKRLEQVRKDFVANVSHELRTPLTSIKGYAETLISSKRPDAETLTSFMKVIQKNANNMAQMLEDLLHLAKLESTPDKQELESVSLNLALISAWEVCKPQAEEKGIFLDNKLPRRCSVLSNYDQLVRVLINLLDNAIKYSPNQGHIVVFAREEDDMCCLSMQDSGPGIPKNEQKRVFERFYRGGLQDHGQEQKTGTGLGLSICKHIIVEQGGTIWIESPIKGDLKGTIVNFCLQKSDKKGD